MSFTTASAILRGKWLLDKSWAQQHLPMALRLMRGENVEFGQKDSTRLPVAKITGYAASAPMYNVRPYSSTDEISSLPGGSIALVNITGPVLKYGDICSYGSVDHTALVNRLANADNIAGILLNIDSPGGQADGTAMLSDAIKEAAGKKPVIAMVDDGLAASAAMWIASAATEIYTTKKTDQVGSIGVYTTLADWYSYFEKEGLKVQDIYAPQSTEKNLPYREATAGNDSLIKEDLRVLASEFINVIQANRAGKLSSEAWNTGKLFYAKEAKRIGLIDGIMSTTKIVQRMNDLVSDSRENQISNSTTMSFEKTLKASGADQFAVVEGGFLLTEEQLNSIEENISASETAAADAAQKISDLEGVNQKNTETIADQKTQITQLQARVAELEKSGPDFSGTSREEDDDPAEANEFETSFDREAREMKKFIV